MKKEKKKNQKFNSDTSSNSLFLDKNPILKIIVKSILLILILSIGIVVSDRKGYFDPDQTNNHTKKKWDTFYSFVEKNEVDLLLMGNSHMYSGINPKNLSNTLGLNAFILASPGTRIIDTYFGLKEALQISKPKLVVIETYGINNFNPYELSKQNLSDQFKSFYARKSLKTKLLSTVSLFKSDNYLYAWSNSIRNHEFIFKDTTQLSKNFLLAQKKPKKNRDLYLGRFAAFNKGISKKILAKYNTDGAPVNGEDYDYSIYAEKYVDKIVALCKEKNIELIFLTLPMYHKHIENYATWKNKLGEILHKHPNKWMDMQSDFDRINFTTNCFQDTYKSNQHMTYYGSLIASYKLAGFIKTELNIELPNRKKEVKWRKMFFGQEGFFENNPVMQEDKTNRLLWKNKKINGLIIDEVSVIKEDKKKYVLIAKIKKQKQDDLSKCKLSLLANTSNQEQDKIVRINLNYDKLHQLTDQYIFKSQLKPIEIYNLVNASVICN